MQAVGLGRNTCAHHQQKWRPPQQLVMEVNTVATIAFTGLIVKRSYLCVVFN